MAQRFSKIFAVTGAVLTCVSIPSYASFNGLTEQDEFNIKLRSIYFDRDYDNDASDDSTFAQGIELNYQSGYFNDLISMVSLLIRYLITTQPAAHKIIFYPLGMKKAALTIVFLNLVNILSTLNLATMAM
ncbi:MULTISPECIES: OprD family porin [unclassified Pseudoalteromonas]|jgi:hypothetical protein|uniref:OprD family porin n=1 Tax=unclassified Pseudoalteromonas TaxID=194690 RepID=UPI0004204004|nr:MULTISPECIES: OprD family porin [unclassified Pseudoalteromonas]